jgi:hypothetical protein
MLPIFTKNFKENKKLSKSRKTKVKKRKFELKIHSVYCEILLRMVSSKEYIVLKSPEKYESDRNKYKLLKLQNELKVLLVQKPKIERIIDNEVLVSDNLATVALCVDIGSFEDPIEVQGLAHFLEHMVGVFQLNEITHQTYIELIQGFLGIKKVLS